MGQQEPVKDIMPIPPSTLINQATQNAGFKVDDIYCILERAIEAEKELEAVKQAYWNTRAKLGFDNDGDPTPKAMTFPTFDQLILMDADELLGERIEREQKARALEGVVRSLVDWDKAFPKGRIYPIGPNDADKQLDAICEKAKAQLQSATTDKEWDGKG